MGFYLRAIKKASSIVKANGATGNGSVLSGAVKKVSKANGKLISGNAFGGLLKKAAKRVAKNTTTGTNSGTLG